MIYCINCINVRSFNMTINLCYPFAHLIVGVIFKADCRTPTRPDHKVRLSRPRPRPRPRPRHYMHPNMHIWHIWPYLAYLRAYLGASTMVKWGVPEKILQNAVQTRWS